MHISFKTFFKIHSIYNAYYLSKRPITTLALMTQNEYHRPFKQGKYYSGRFIILGLEDGDQMHWCLNVHQIMEVKHK